MSLDNLKRVVTIGAKMGNIAGKALVDGKISAGDIVLLPDIAGVFVDLIRVSWKDVPEQVRALPMAEYNSLIEHFKIEFNIPQRIVEVAIEEVLGTVVHLAGVIHSLVVQTKK